MEMGRKEKGARAGSKRVGELVPWGGRSGKEEEGRGMDLGRGGVTRI